MRLEVSEQARERLFGIWLRIRETSSEERADKVQERLLVRAQELLEHPWKGPPERELAVLNEGSCLTGTRSSTG